MADSTVGQLANIRDSAPAGLFLKTTGNEDYSQGGRFVGTKPFKGEFYHISGTTLDNGTPSSREVYLINAINPYIIIEKQISLPDGSFDFKYLLQGVYTVFGVNLSGSQDDVIHANITAVEM